MMKLTVAFVLLATAAADNEFNFLASSTHKMATLASNCTVCGVSLGVTSPSIASCPSTSKVAVVTGTCGGSAFTATCTNGAIAVTGAGAGDVTTGSVGSATQIGCSAPAGAAGAKSDCTDNCPQKAVDINDALDTDGLSGAKCNCVVNNCTVSGRQMRLRKLRQSGGLSGNLIFSCNCSNLTGDAQTTCCVNCLRAFACAGADFDSCSCNGNDISCPSCGNNKDSPKLLLLLLLLLLLIPLLLCCLLLLCCCLRRKKREADTHFSTFDPQGPIATPLPMPAPMPVALPTCHGAPMTCAPVMEHCIPDSHCGAVPVLPSGGCLPSTAMPCF